MQNNISLDEYINDTTEISTARDYWFVRTDHGKYYNIFSEKGVIAIGWNIITVADIKQFVNSGNDDHIRNKLVAESRRKEEKRAAKKNTKVNPKNIINPASTNGKRELTQAINKLVRFYSLRKGDVVLIPSERSEYLNFGIIEDDITYSEKESDECKFRKRRKVKWVIERKFVTLDKRFFNLKKSWHAVTSVKKDLEEYIDRVMNNTYFKNGYGHYVVRVTKQSDVSATDLFTLGITLIDLLKYINDVGGFNEDIDDTVVKINVQSEGDFLLKNKLGKAIVGLSFMVNAVGCSPNADSADLGTYAPRTQEQKQLVDTLWNKVNELGVLVETAE